MTEKTENLVLELLRAMRSDIANIKQDIREMKGQLISIRHYLVVTDSDAGPNEEGIAHLQVRVERSERRLELASEP